MNKNKVEIAIFFQLEQSSYNVYYLNNTFYGVFERLQIYKAKLNKKKIDFGKEELVYETSNIEIIKCFKTSINNFVIFK